MASVAYNQTYTKHESAYFSKLDLLIKELNDASSNIVLPSVDKKTPTEILREKHSTNLKKLREMVRAESMPEDFL